MKSFATMSFSLLVMLASSVSVAALHGDIRPPVVESRSSQSIDRPRSRSRRNLSSVSCSTLVLAERIFLEGLYGPSFACSCHETVVGFEVDCRSLRDVCCLDMCAVVKNKISYDYESDLKALEEETCHEYTSGRADELLDRPFCTRSVFCPSGEDTCGCTASFGGELCNSCSTCDHSFYGPDAVQLSVNCDNLMSVNQTFSADCFETLEEVQNSTSLFQCSAAVRVTALFGLSLTSLWIGTYSL